MNVPLNGLSGKPHVSNDTFVSAGLFLSILIAVVLVLNSLNNAKTDIVTRLTRVELNQADQAQKISDVAARKSDWSYSDMFKWAVHLQRDNPQIKVPEPDQKP